MSNEKSKPLAGSDDKKVFDISKPGKSAPTASAKPIIITNRPVLKDPMVTSTEAAAPVTGIPSPSKPRTKITIAPINEKVESAAKESTSTDTPPEAMPQPIEADHPEPAAEEAKAEAPSEQPAQPAEAAAPESEPSKSAAEPAAEAASTPGKSTPVNEKPAEEPKADAAEATTDDAQKTSEKVDEEAARKEAERQAELQKLAESKKYYLPIETVEKRRNKRDILIGLVFVLILAAVWVDVALDSGMLHIQGVRSLTHFFNK